MALMCRLTKLNLTSIAKALMSATTARSLTPVTLWPILDACGLTKENSVQEGVGACLPLLFVQIAELRRKNRAHVQALRREGKLSAHDANECCARHDSGAINITYLTIDITKD
jgi:hypothetical protein